MGGMSLLDPGPHFDEFVQSSSPHLLRLAYRLTGHRQLAEDLLQTAYVRVAGRWSSARANPVAYARQTLVHLATDSWRARSRRPEEVPLDDVSATHGLDQSASLEDRDELLAAMRALPPVQRTVLVLRYWEDLSVEETAALLGCSQGNVKSSSSRGLARLREVLQPEGVRA